MGSYCRSGCRNGSPSSAAIAAFTLLWLLLIVPTSPFSPTRIVGTPIARKNLLVVPAHRNIIVLSHNVSQTVADGLFDVNNLLTGRVDVLTRCVNSAIWVSNGIRKDTAIFLMLFPHNITIEIQGETICGLNPDERTMALYLQRTLLVGSSGRRGDERVGGWDVVPENNESMDGKRPAIVNPHKPGSRSKSQKRALRVTRKAREAMLRRIDTSKGNATSPQGFVLHRDDSLKKRIINLRKKDGPILMFNETGEPLWDVIASVDFKQRQEKETTIILGDQIGYAPSDEKFLAENTAVTQVSLGPLSLLTSQCITITHHYMDTNRL